MVEVQRYSNPFRESTNLFFHAEEMTDAINVSLSVLDKAFKSKGSLSNGGIPNINHTVWEVSWEAEELPSPSEANYSFVSARLGSGKHTVDCSSVCRGWGGGVGDGGETHVTGTLAQVAGICLLDLTLPDLRQGASLGASFFSSIKWKQ